MSSNVEYNRIQDQNIRDSLSNEDKFLFLIKPDFTAKESICGCSLRTGSIIISILIMISNFSNFMESLQFESDSKVLINGLICLVYFSACVLIFISSMNNNYKHCFFAYIIYAISFIFNLLDTIIMTFLIFLGFYNPLRGLDFFRAGFVYLLSSLLILTIYLYFVWIIYSYYILLKDIKTNTIHLSPQEVESKDV
jgi:hypothetical protein